MTFQPVGYLLFQSNAPDPNSKAPPNARSKASSNSTKHQHHSDQDSISGIFLRMIHIIRRCLHWPLYSIYLHNTISACPHTRILRHRIARPTDWARTPRLLLVPSIHHRRKPMGIIFRHRAIPIVVPRGWRTLSCALPTAINKEESKYNETDDSAPAHCSAHDNSEIGFGRGR
jgi:hypothetical protein